MLVDIAIFPFVRQCANVDHQWFENNYSKLTLWLERISSSDLFVEIMKKHELWNSKNNNGEKVASGVYIYKIRTSDFIQSKKMILLNQNHLPKEQHLMILHTIIQRLH